MQRGARAIQPKRPQMARWSRKIAWAKTTAALLGWVALLSAGGVASAQSLLAQADSANPAYTVRDIRATKTAASGLKAQKEAMRGARTQALTHLFQRLVPVTHHSLLPVLPPEQVDALVSSVDIQQEQVTATAYTGQLAISFLPSGIAQVLKARNIPYTDQISPPLIIVPVYERAGARQLWETPNAWDSAWRARVGAQGLVTTTMARGDPSEQLVISADQAVGGDSARIQALAQNYDARGAIVALAKFRIDPRNGQPSLEASLTGYGLAPAGPLNRTFVGSSGLTGGADKATDDLAVAAAAGLSEMLAEAWKQQNVATATAGTGEILATVALSYLGDYGNISRQLQTIPAVQSFAPARITAQEATFRLNLRGGPTQAQQVFQQYGLSLVQGPTGWTLKPGG